MAIITKEQLEQASVDAGLLRRFRTGNSDETIPTDEGLKPTIAGIVKQALQSASLDTMPGDTFTTGATLTNQNQGLLDPVSNEYYRWSGNFPIGGKVVPANSTPANSGGIGPGKWLAAGSAALAVNLAKPTGWQLIGVSPSGTIKDAIKYVTPEMFGAVGDNVNDDTIPLRTAISTGKCILTQTYKTTSEINIPSRAHIIGHGTINFTGLGNALKSVDTDDILLEGFRVKGTGKSAFDQVGLLMGGNKGCKLIALTFDSINGKGFSIDGGRYIDAYGDKIATIGITLLNCTTGMYIAPNLTAGTYPNEYCTHANVQAVNCNTGIQMGAGNHTFNGGRCSGNIDGFDIIDGYNSAHGTIVGMQFNHNSRYNLHAKNASAGLAIAGCTFYGDDATTGTIYLENSRGFVFNGCMMESTVYTDGAFSWNMASDCYNNGNFGLLLAGTHGNRFIVNNWIGQNGPSTLNREAFDYACVNRSSDQSIATGSDIKIIFNALYYKNIMMAYDLVGGVYTAPFSGFYSISLNLLFSGVTSGYCSLKVGAAAICHFPITAVSGGICAGSKEVYLNAGEQLTVTANVAGTSVLVKAGTVSGLSIKKV